eukprot:2918380-Pyramimonas_sp.AAC.1
MCYAVISLGRDSETNPRATNILRHDVRPWPVGLRVSAAGMWTGGRPQGREGRGREICVLSEHARKSKRALRTGGKD